MSVGNSRPAWETQSDPVSTAEDLQLRLEWSVPNIESWFAIIGMSEVKFLVLVVELTIGFEYKE